MKQMRVKRRSLAAGRYETGNSLFHRLDARTKIIFCLGVIMLMLVRSNWTIILATMGVTLTMLFMAGAKPDVILHALRYWMPLFIFSLVFQGILTAGEPLIQLGGVVFTCEGLWLGLSLILRMLVLYLCSCLLTRTTSPTQLASGIEALLLPLGFLGLPVYQVSMAISTSLRFIPIILEEAEIITQAQKSRGAPLSSGSVIKRLKAVLAILIPIFTASMQRAENLALAMDSRCYGGEVNRTRIDGMSFGLRDFFVLGGIVLFCTLSLVYT